MDEVPSVRGQSVSARGSWKTAIQAVHSASHGVVGGQGTITQVTRTRIAEDAVDVQLRAPPGAVQLPVRYITRITQATLVRSSRS